MLLYMKINAGLLIELEEGGSSSDFDVEKADCDSFFSAQRCFRHK